MGSFVFYITIFSFSIGCIMVSFGYTKKRVSELYGIAGLFSVTILILFATIRKNTGTDWVSYNHAFNEIKGIDAYTYISGYLTERLYDFEIGYYFINRISYFLGNQYILVLAISSVLTVAVTYYGIKKFRDELCPVLSWYIFIMLLYAPSYNTIRQSIAVSITLWATFYLFSGQNIKYIITIFIASLFHRSAVICLFFPLLRVLNYSRILRLFYYLAILLTPLTTYVLIRITLNISFIKPVFQKYQFSYNGGGLGFLIDVLLPTIPFVIYKTSVFQDKRMTLLLNCYLLKVPFRYFAYYVTFLERLMEYTVGIEVLLIPMLVKKIKEKKARNSLYIYYTAWYFIYFLYRYVLINTGHIIPYSYK